MGIQINGQTDTISASDGGLAVSGYELTGASNINVTGIITTSQLNVGTGGTVITTTSDGKIGINSTSPSAETMDIVGNAPKINIDSTNGLSGFRLNIIQSSSQLFRVQNAGTTAFEVNSNGNTLLANGNLVFSTAGTGIDFSATSDAAGMTSELLDDYEEGTWSPGITSSSLGNGIFSYTVTYAKYTKVGRLVNIAARITGINWTGSPSGYMQITGAPFTKTTDHFPTSAVTMYYTTFGADSYNTLEFITASTSTIMYVRTTTNGAVGTDLQIGSVNNGNGGLIMSITYYA